MNNLYINQLETENKQLRETLKQVRAGTNELNNELHNKLDAQDKIINEQALEIARLKEDKQKAIEYIKRDDIFVEQENNGGRDIEGNLILIKYSVKLNLLEILGDKE